MIPGVAAGGRFHPGIKHYADELHEQQGGGGIAQQAAFGVFGILVLGIALRMVRRSPWLTWVAVLLALPIVVLAVINVLAPDARLAVLTAGLESVFYFYAAGSLIAYMLQDDVASTDELFAVAAVSWPPDWKQAGSHI